MPDFLVQFFFIFFMQLISKLKKNISITFMIDIIVMTVLITIRMIKCKKKKKKVENQGKGETGEIGRTTI